jgi:hypothetical protein
LNNDCFCFSLGQAGLSVTVRERCPHLFSGQPVFVSAAHLPAQAEPGLQALRTSPAEQTDGACHCAASSCT